ncbi:DUF397 domain-containing protein [Amycolatopsis sp. NPDC051758]|uniref:DUF397 domain-containing protein n=1 Tax=Amycolatopsis sp. NPDC051758 TaxID=3363935 RepID=UPI00379C0A15
MDHVIWRKSSYSGTESNCVEVGWRKSSYSGGQSECVEVKLDHSVGIRDTKAREHGQLAVSRAAWIAAVTALRG